MTDKEQYEAALKIVRGASEAVRFVDLPRCVTCIHQIKGVCQIHCYPVPAEYMYTPNECREFDNVPF